MSARNLGLILAPRAQRDFANLLSYSEQRWGGRQRLRYQARIDRALREVTRFPELGSTRDDIRPGLRAYRASEHVIYYRHDEQTITVLRLLHHRMDPEQQFSAEGSAIDRSRH